MAVRRIVCLNGGLGNQLFQLAYAEWLRAKFGAMVRVDQSLLRPSGRSLSRRKVEIEPALFGFREQTLPRSIWKIPSRFRPNQFREVIGFSQTPNPGDGYQFEVVRGYFQSAKMVSEVEHVFVPRLREILPSFGVQNYVSVHIRLGDYLEPNKAAFHGVTDPHWSIKQAQLLAEKVGANRIVLFSDAPEFVVDSVDESLLREIHFEAEESPKAIVSMMASSAGIVMSNSSLSWWAAYLSSEREIPVVYPKPWLAFKSDLDLELHVATWSAVARDLLEISRHDEVGGA